MTRNTASEFIDAVEEHVNRVAGSCSHEKGPLLADGLDLETGAPLVWKGHLLSNLACQQNVLRTLEALGTLTGENRYHQQANRWIGYALEKLSDSASDLFYWGGHTSYDLLTDKPVLGNHEMKCVYPHYAYLYRMDADSTSQFIKAFWHTHIWDWSSLLFNRHGNYESWEEKWQTKFTGGPLPIVENSALSFVNTGSDLILSGVMLHALAGDETPLRWAQHLLSRYDDIRHPETGLAGYQFNHRQPCRVRASFKPPFDQREDLNEATVVTNGVIRVRYGRAAVTWLNAAEALAEKKAKPFRDLVTADLKALVEHCYNWDDYCFYPAINDGTRLYPENTNEGVGYCSPAKLRKVPAEGLMFLSYARAFKVTGMELFRQMAFHLAEGMGWGNLQSAVDFESHTSPQSTEAWANAGQNDACALFGLLELYTAIGEKVLLQSATSLGRHLQRRYQVNGLMVSGERSGQTNIDSALPLALLHLEAASQGDRTELPAFYPNNTYFDPKVVIYHQANKKKSKGRQ
ncbi:TPA: hypothetical protein EYN65_01635 [Candidatus Poribacteria bacterium]|nr:hypothetical protein [Candidatus Poribacteria bacterium]HIC02056.1 hypothetical protein [Candidatus Poribacteria bacterium]HIN30860.1 hypothetical protein [Candidatus Poribacteria bacterium]HIO81405.1 hypothetical protein [Candidatus Poribacteria bacterium]